MLLPYCAKFSNLNMETFYLLYAIFYTKSSFILNQIKIKDFTTIETSWQIPHAGQLNSGSGDGSKLYDDIKENCPGSRVTQVTH